jgi:hypothetical protein
MNRISDTPAGNFIPERRRRGIFVEMTNREKIPRSVRTGIFWELGNPPAGNWTE